MPSLRLLSDVQLQPFQDFCQRHHLTTLPLHVHQIVNAFLFYEAIFLLVSPALSQILINRVYAQLPRRTRVNWNVRVVSTIQATFVCFSALQVIFSDPARRSMSRDERLWAYSSSSGRVQAYAAGYFLWDVLVSVQHLDVLGPGSLVHALSALMVTITGFRPFANFYGINFVLYELSTPFLNINWFLDKFGMTGSRWQLYNGVCLLASFFGCRLVWGNYQTVNLSRDALEAWSEAASGRCLESSLAGGNVSQPSQKSPCGQDFPAALLIVYLLSNAILSGLNVYWFYLMLKALRRRLKSSDKGTK